MFITDSWSVWFWFLQFWYQSQITSKIRLWRCINSLPDSLRKRSSCNLSIQMTNSRWSLFSIFHFHLFKRGLRQDSPHFLSNIIIFVHLLYYYLLLGSTTGFQLLTYRMFIIIYFLVELKLFGCFVHSNGWSIFGSFVFLLLILLIVLCCIYHKLHVVYISLSTFSSICSSQFSSPLAHSGRVRNEKVCSKRRLRVFYLRKEKKTQIKTDFFSNLIEKKKSGKKREAIRLLQVLCFSVHRQAFKLFQTHPCYFQAVSSSAEGAVIEFSLL